jgi:sulfide:quinone oxidoreductase
MAGKAIIVLGGGTGGLVAANRLRRMLHKEHRILLVSRSPVYSFESAYTWVMTGRRTGRRISRDLRKLEKRGIEFLMAEVEGIDPATKLVRAGGRELNYDYLVVALGAEYSSDEIEGLGRTWTFYHLDGAEGLQEQLPRIKGGRIVFVVSSLPYKCPPAMYEGALLLDDYLRRRRLRDESEIEFYTPETIPLKEAAGTAAGRVIEMINKRGISLTAAARLKAVDHRHKQLRFDDGSAAPFDMVIATPVHRAPEVLVRSGLAAPGGWVEVDRETMATKFPDVYAVGDCTVIPTHGGLTLPKAGVFAHGEAEVVARNLSAEITGGEPIWAFGGQGAYFVDAGGGRAAYMTGDFYKEGEPEVAIRGPGRLLHLARAGIERLWLWRWF